MEVLLRQIIQVRHFGQGAFCSVEEQFGGEQILFYEDHWLDLQSRWKSGSTPSARPCRRKGNARNTQGTDDYPHF